ncbi:DNA-directed RNA polymerases II, IV and V subunit 9B [Hibiscus syriacus]|uniref:DNA-directed RNA polymerases II, IV and V subunit 9B n=1 Tax=Hibiscus syriacus TaxID=106335 RepID=A0A6A3AJH7_HIBSY|nr:DNA-directed RNA polymerases II, IV and V subunit 9B [Hibiscus syriacus]
MADSARDMEGVKASNQPSGGEQMLETKGNDINSSSSNQPSPSASSFDGGALPDHDPPPTENGLTVGTVSKEEIDKYKIYRTLSDRKLTKAGKLGHLLITSQASLSVRFGRLSKEKVSKDAMQFIDFLRTASIPTLRTSSKPPLRDLLTMATFQSVEVAENNCVYRNEVHHSAGERTQVLQDVAADPTLPRTKAIICANCKHGEAVFFQGFKSRSRRVFGYFGFTVIATVAGAIVAVAGNSDAAKPLYRGRGPFLKS